MDCGGKLASTRFILFHFFLTSLSRLDAVSHINQEAHYCYTMELRGSTVLK